jgi:peptidoglycan L-alanyl-D-glutamate endopeptidase CwlK
VKPLSAKDRERLAGVHPDLVRVVSRTRALTSEFVVLEGVRTVVRQEEIFATGGSERMSRHLTGHAVDLGATVEGQVCLDWPLHQMLAKVVKQAAEDVGVNVTWGGDWRRGKNGAHWELSREQYPN